MYVQVCGESGARNESKKSDLCMLETLNKGRLGGQLAAMAMGASSQSLRTWTSIISSMRNTAVFTTTLDVGVTQL